MKLYKILFIISIALLPLLYGCPENNTVTTKINRDGSCIRTVGDFDPRNFEGIDSIKQDIPIPVDQSWFLMNINDSTAVLQKEFKNVEELNGLYSLDESELKMYKREVELEKKFRWFHTLFIYREIYGGILTRIPLSNYMSNEEVQVFKGDDSSNSLLLKNMAPKASVLLQDNIEERGSLWLHDNLMAIAFDDILEIANKYQIVNKNNIDPSVLYDSVKLKIDKSDKMLIDFGLGGSELDMKDLANLIGTELSLDSTTIAHLIQKVETVDLEEKYDNEIFGGFINDFRNQILMPGQLIGANADEIRGDTLDWNVGFVKFMDSDYIMYAESKITNDWAYLVSGFILTIALIIPFLRRRKV